MGMDPQPYRYRRSLRADTFIRLTPISLTIQDRGLVSATYLTQTLATHSIDARDIVFARHDDDAANVIRWEGTGHDGERVTGRLSVNITHEDGYVVVSGEIVLVAVTFR